MEKVILWKVCTQTDLEFGLMRVSVRAIMSGLKFNEYNISFVKRLGFWWDFAYYSEDENTFAVAIISCIVNLRYILINYQNVG